jgi:hypothetical protein
MEMNITVMSLCKVNVIFKSCRDMEMSITVISLREVTVVVKAEHGD